MLDRLGFIVISITACSSFVLLYTIYTISRYDWVRTMAHILDQRIGRLNKLLDGTKANIVGGTQDRWTRVTELFPLLPQWYCLDKNNDLSSQHGVTTKLFMSTLSPCVLQTLPILQLSNSSSTLMPRLDQLRDLERRLRSCACSEGSERLLPLRRICECMCAACRRGDLPSGWKTLNNEIDTAVSSLTSALNLHQTGTQDSHSCQDGVNEEKDADRKGETALIDYRKLLTALAFGVLSSLPEVNDLISLADQYMEQGQVYCILMNL